MGAFNIKNLACLCMVLAMACGERNESNAGVSSSSGGSGGSGGSAGGSGGVAGAAGGRNSGTGGTAGGGPGGMAGFMGSCPGGFSGAGGTWDGGCKGEGGNGGATGNCWFPWLPDQAYELTLHDVVDRTPVDGSVAPAPLSEGAKMRVDLRHGTLGGYSGWVTPRWADWQALYQGERNGDVAVLRGWATIGEDPPGTRIEAWSTLRVPILPDGGIDVTRSVEAAGTHPPPPGLPFLETLEAVGTITKDMTRPDYRWRDSVLPGDQWLPWQDLAFQFSEPVVPEAIEAGVSARMTALGSTSSTPLPVRWLVQREFDGSMIALAVTAAATWEGFAGATVQVRLPGCSVVDSLHHTASTDFSTTFTFFDVGPIQMRSGLGRTDAPLPARWGDVSFRGGAVADPLCESGACAVLGPYMNGTCGVARNGIAGRLLVTPPSTLRVPAVRIRYQVMSAEKSTPDLPGFTVELANEGGTLERKFDLPELVDRGSDAGELRYASAVTELVTYPPHALPELGFAIYVGNRRAIGCNPPPGLAPSTKTQLVIHGVVVE